ncbi:hypothetical protein [Candidatus Sororendozoicomonas aggregata]|uniref:hypothetical protein n=1 Tax=Candidatus Sororendozoicomonas aggregata TaxID=3073239 RepID=UPI002ED69C43
MSFSAPAIEYAGVGAYAHARYFTAICRLNTITGTSKAAVKKDLNRLCGGKCDTMAIVAQGDKQLCGAVGLKLDNPFYAYSRSGYGRTEKEAKQSVALGLAYDKDRIKTICVPAAIDYRLNYGFQLVDDGFPKSVKKNFPSLIKHLQDKDTAWNRNIIAAIAGDSRNPSSYYFLLDNKTYIWFDGDVNEVYGPAPFNNSKDWPGITKAIGSNTIVAGFYYPPDDKTYFFLSNNTCFQFLNGHVTQPESIANVFGTVIHESIVANKGLTTAFYDPDKEKYYFFFKNGKYQSSDNHTTYKAGDVNANSWPGIDHDSFTNPKYYNKFMINTKENKIYDFVLRRA